ncbi:MAG: O-antigen ligase family protein [Bdellovibrionales bacterium]
MTTLEKWILGLFGLSLVAAFTSQSLVDLSDILLTLTALTLAFRRKRFRFFFTSFRPAGLWVVWLVTVIVGLGINVGFQDPKPWNEFLEFRWILTFLAILFLVGELSAAAAHLHQVWLWLLIPLNAAALVLFLQDPHWRVQGILKQTMSFSHNIAPLWCLFAVSSLISWKTLSRREQGLRALVVLTTGLLTLFTFTRGVWIGSAVAALAALWLWNRKAFSAALLGGLALAATLVFTNQRIHDRVFTKTVNETQSNDERWALWRGNWRMIQDYPLLGVGFQQNKYHLRRYYDEFGYPPGQRESHAHNQYLQVWGGTGTLGLLCFVAFNFLLLRLAVQGYRKSTTVLAEGWHLGLFSALLCFMIGALTESNFNIAKNRLLFLIFAGFAVHRALKLSNPRSGDRSSDTQNLSPA